MHSFGWGSLLNSAKVWTGMLIKPCVGIALPRTEVIQWLRPIWGICMKPAALALRIRRKPQNGTCEPRFLVLHERNSIWGRGAGVERNDEDAAHWIGEAADAGCPTAMAALSYLYANGKGVPRDEQKARELQKAAKKNGPRLCSSLGREPSDARLFH